MPKIKVVFFQDNGKVPVLDWLDTVPSKVKNKCYVKISRLAHLGHELRRPEADILRDKIYELRIGFQGMNYRILYFFYGTQAVILAEGLIKERIVPAKAISTAIKRKKAFEANPDKHTYKEG